MNRQLRTMKKLVLFFKSHIDAYTRKDGSVVHAHDDKRLARQADLFDNAGATHDLPSDKRLPDHNEKSHGDSHSYGSKVISRKPAGHWAYTNEHGKHSVIYSVGNGQYAGTDMLSSKEDAFKQAHERMKARGILT